MTTTCESCAAPVVTRHCIECGQRRAETATQVDEMTAHGRRTVWIGLAMMVGGMLVTFATFVNADGGTKFLALIGLVVVGLWRTVRGLKAMRDAERLPRI